MRRHMMIDEETFSTRPDAAIVQLGAHVFSPDGGGERFGLEYTISLQSVVLLGAHVDIDPERKDATVNWWKRQAPEAITSICTEAVPIQVALDGLDRFWAANECVAAWSHGANFDIPILDWTYAQLGRKAPWAYNAVRDTRTLFWIAKGMGWMKPDPDRIVAHTGLADAEAQADDVISALHHIKDCSPLTWEGLCNEQ